MLLLTGGRRNFGRPQDAALFSHLADLYIGMRARQSLQDRAVNAAAVLAACTNNASPTMRPN
jgi:hypothetical protein